MFVQVGHNTVQLRNCEIVKAFTIFESKKYDELAPLKKDLPEGIKVTSALQNELMHLSQGDHQSCKESADNLHEKLRDICEILRNSFQNEEIISSFKIESAMQEERIKEWGPKAISKYRILNYGAESVDELVKKVVEE